MTAVSFYFQMHQPRRLKRFSVFDTGRDYFDDQRNRQILRRVSQKCYLPATAVLMDQIKAMNGEFRIAFSISGTLLDQLLAWEPDVIDRLRELAQTGCVEFLAETYHHSLAFLYDPDEFHVQVHQHAEAIESALGQRPRVFRNTELIYNNEVAETISAWGEHSGVISEGVPAVLSGRTCNRVYQPATAPDLSLLLKNFRLSDDIAFRFSNQNWSGYPLTPEKFAQRLTKDVAESVPSPEDDSSVVGLFMDFETFGEHQWAQTGILNFLGSVPRALKKAGCSFMTPSECFDQYPPADRYDCPQMTSWADSERDISAWLGNAMQTSATMELYRLGHLIRETGDEQIVTDWRRLTTSDHVYYMATKTLADGEVHAYFNPYDSPYDAYINFMNVLDNLRVRLERTGRSVSPPLDTVESLTGPSASDASGKIKVTGKLPAPATAPSSPPGSAPQSNIGSA